MCTIVTNKILNSSPFRRITKKQNKTQVKI